MNLPKSSHLLVIAAIVIACLAFMVACVLPQDVDAANVAAENYKARVETEIAKYKAGDQDIAAFNAAVAAARADLKADMQAIVKDVKDRTASIGSGAVVASDPLSLILTAGLSVAGSIWGTNKMRNVTRKAELARIDASIAETDAWVQDVEQIAKAS